MRAACHILLGALALLWAGCRRESGTRDLVARVGEKSLSWDQLRDVIPDEASPEDSAMLAERYVQDWIKEEVILGEAEQNLPDDRKDFAEQIENYRRSLLKYAYEQEWVRQKLDTAVSGEEIEAYYNENIQNFQLKDYIVKVKFCAISADADSRRIKSLRKLFYSNDPEDITPWIRLCVDLGASYYFDEDKWMLWDEFIQQIPLKVYDREGFLRNNRDVEFTKDNNLYLIRITDYQLSGSQSPLSFERDKIREMILNRRKLDLLNRMREDLYVRATSEGRVETFFEKP